MRIAPEVGIDLGTTNILVYRRGKGLVLNEPTVVAVGRNGKMLAVGNAAKDMLGRTPQNITAIRPLKDGVIADYTTTLKMLDHILGRTCGVRRVFKPRVLICVPSGATNVEKRAVIQAAREAGAGEALTIEEPMAAAMGAGLPVTSAGGNLVVDIGGGTTDIAVISLGGIVLSHSLRVGGQKLDEAIIRHIRNAHNVMIGEATAEEIKLRIGSVVALNQELAMEIRGRDLVTSMPKSLEISSEEIRQALLEPVRLIAEKVCLVLEETPPELSSDIIQRGIVLTGGGALVPGIDVLLHEATDIPVRVAENALSCVAVGTGKALDDLPAIRQSGAVTTI